MDVNEHCQTQIKVKEQLFAAFLHFTCATSDKIFPHVKGGQVLID
jgi:hypothetical protein